MIVNDVASVPVEEAADLDVLPTVCAAFVKTYVSVVCFDVAAVVGRN